MRDLNVNEIKDVNGGLGILMKLIIIKQSEWWNS